MGLTWVETAVNGGAWVVVLGIVKVMLHGKVNKPECELMHSRLSDDVVEIKKSVQDISISAQDIKLHVAGLKRENGKVG